MAEPQPGSPNSSVHTLTDTTQEDNSQSNTTDTSPYPRSQTSLKADKAGLSAETQWRRIRMETGSKPDQGAQLDATAHGGSDSLEDTTAMAVISQREDELASGRRPDVDVAGHTQNGLEKEEMPASAKGSSPSQLNASADPARSELAEETRLRSDSRSTVATHSTHSTQRPTPISSVVFVITALEAIISSKESRRSKELEDAAKKALANIKQPERQPLDPEIIFHPLQLATKTFSIPLQVTALDCIGKLITYSYFAFPSNRSPTVQENDPASEQLPLIERAIETICDCFENEATPVEIQQQIIKSLLAAVLNDKIVVHGAGLLKAVRQIYNIFIYSKSSQNQQIAQGSLTQMVGTVFDRVRYRLDLKESRIRDAESQLDSSPDGTTLEAVDGNHINDQDGSSEVASTIMSDQPVTKEPTEKLTLQSFESSKDDAMVNDSAPTTVTRARVIHRSSRSVSAEERDDVDSSAEDEEDEIYIKDAFLVFRALCKLSHKILSHDQQQDVKSQNMRSKLLSLHLIHYLLNNHVTVFTSPLATIRNSTNNADSLPLLHAIRTHLCLSLSRNGSSSISRVFEVCCEIFWLMLKYMRVTMKVSYMFSIFSSLLTFLTTERT